MQEYCLTAEENFLNKYRQLEDSDLTMDAFSFYTSVSAVFSSKIEGEDIELDSYVKHKRFGIAYLPDYTQKLTTCITPTSLQSRLPAISKILNGLTKYLPGTFCLKTNRGSQNRQYVCNYCKRKDRICGSLSFWCESRYGKIYKDLQKLIKAQLDIKEVFYYASMLHLVFVKIHPFDDGNGRTSRLRKMVLI